MKHSETPVLLLTGYLGSGKTTLLNRILANKRGIKFAVVVNDIGEVNIDETLIRKEGIVGGKNSDDLVALQNGCICCTLKMDLVKQLAELTASGLFDYIVIEASGICEPEPIAQTICSMPQMDFGSYTGSLPVLDCIATVVDALRMATEFGCGDALQRDGLDEEDIENLIIEQIEFCNLIVLNKISEVTPAQAAHIKAIIRALQPGAKIIECDYADIDLDNLINTHLFNFEKVATSATWVKELEGHHDDDDDEHEHHHHDHEDDDEHDEHEHHHDDDDDEHEHHHHEHDDDDDDEHEHHHHDHDDEHEGHHHHHHHHHDHEEGEAEEYGIGTFVYYRRRPFDFNKFDYFLAKQWPASVIRTKGVLYFNHNRDMSILFEQAGVQKKIREAGYWYATAPADELTQLMEMEPGLKRDWDPDYGDRMVKLVFIGRKMDREAITAALDACLDTH
jgi:G3E family GTPase